MTDTGRMCVQPLIDGRQMNVGACITGLDLKAGLDEPAREALIRAWHEYGMLVFRDTGAGTEEQVALSKVFGNLEEHPTPELWVDGNPYLIEISGRTMRRAFVFDDDKLLLGRLAWHRDTAFMLSVCRGAMLRLVDVPPEDGETFFADTAAAYDALPDDIKERIDGAEVQATARFDVVKRTPGQFWNKARPATMEEHDSTGAADEEEIAARFPSVIHPLVISHPETGRKCLYFSPWYLDHILGWPKEESDEMLAMLDRHTTSEPFRYAHQWQAGDMVLWDNRRFLHAANGYNPKYTRTGFRTTLADPLLTGRYVDSNAAIKAPARAYEV